MQASTTIDAAAQGQSWSRVQWMLAIFAGALAIRWAYDLTLYSMMGDQWLMVGDSAEYTGTAIEFAKALRAGSASWIDFLGTGPYRMPLFHWLATVPYLLFGERFGVLGYVMMQGAIDAGTCVVVYLMAEMLSHQTARIAGILAAINPTQIVLAGIFYTDTPFTFLFALGLLGAFRWCREPTIGSGVLAGAGFGCAALVRAMVVPWGAFALVTIALYCVWRFPRHSVFTLAAGASIFALSVGIIVSKNWIRYGTLRLSPQAGIYYTGWIVPLAREMHDRRSFFETFEELQKRTKDRFGPTAENPFEQSDRLMVIGREAAADLPWTAFAKSFVSGMFINLSSPGILLSPPVFFLPRTGFYESQGTSFAEKVFNYAFRSGNALYAKILLLGILGIAIMRLIELCGTVGLLFTQQTLLATVFVATWFGYLLLVTGPIASPKYRLPLEPLFSIAGAVGLQAFRKRRGRSSVETATAQQSQNGA